MKSISIITHLRGVTTQWQKVTKIFSFPQIPMHQDILHGVRKYNWTIFFHKLFEEMLKEKVGWDRLRIVFRDNGSINLARRHYGRPFPLSSLGTSFPLSVVIVVGVAVVPIIIADVVVIFGVIVCIGDVVFDGIVVFVGIVIVVRPSVRPSVHVLVDWGGDGEEREVILAQCVSERASKFRTFQAVYGEKNNRRGKEISRLICGFFSDPQLRLWYVGWASQKTIHLRSGMT